jgi:hypothetical protein
MINGRAGLLLPEGYYSNDQPDSSLATIVGDAQDFFRYISGRWVWSEEQQLQENYSEFNIAKLQKVAMEASAGPCVRMEKIGEGSYNKSFSLTIPNKMKVIAQAPNSNAGPAFLTTASEVVTMDFVSDVTR